MHKRIFALLALLLLLSSAGCRFLHSRLETKLPLQVGLLTDGNSVEDAGVNQAVWDSLQQLKIEMPGFDAHYRIPGRDGSYTECSAYLAAQGCTLILCVDGRMAGIIADLAQANSNLTFAVMDCGALELSNVVCLRFAMEEAVYLAGYAAAKVSTSERLGCVHGRLTEETEQLLVSFMAGAKAANSDVVFLRRNILTQKDGGRLTAEEMVANGVDVFFHVDGSADSAVLRVCQENAVWAVGANEEQGMQSEKSMIAFAEKQVETAIKQLITETAENGLKAGCRTFNFANGGISLAVNEDVVPEKSLTSVNNVRDRIAAGEITIPATFEKLIEKYPDLAENP